MRELKWIKFYLNFFDNIKIKEIMRMDRDIVLLYIMLQIEAGKSNKKGRLYISASKAHNVNTIELITGMEKKFIEKAINILEEYEMISISKRGIIKINEFVEQQDIESYYLKKEKTKLRVQKYRKKQRKEIEEISNEINSLEKEDVTEALQVGLQDDFNRVTEKKLESDIGLENTGLGEGFDKCSSVTKRYNFAYVTPLEEEEEEEVEVEVEERRKDNDDNRVGSSSSSSSKNEIKKSKVVEFSSKSQSENKEDKDEGLRTNLTKKLREACFEKVSTNLVDKLLSDCNTFGEAWVMEAISECDLRGIRSYAYLKKILENWKSKGKWNEGAKAFSSKKKADDKRVKEEKDTYKMYDFSAEMGDGKGYGELFEQPCGEA